MAIKQSLNFVKSERGSISVITGGLFVLAIALAVTLSNVASIAMAKRSLTQATEAAAQRGVRNLDKTSYYKGKFNEITMVQNLMGYRPGDPGIPIDCQRAQNDVVSALRDWSHGDLSLKRFEITSVEVERIDCDGFQVSVSTRARTKLAFVLPFINIESVDIASSVSTQNERAKGFYLFGIRIT